MATSHLNTEPRTRLIGQVELIACAMEPGTVITQAMASTMRQSLKEIISLVEPSQTPRPERGTFYGAGEVPYRPEKPIHTLDELACLDGLSSSIDEIGRRLYLLLLSQSVTEKESFLSEIDTQMKMANDLTRRLDDHRCERLNIPE